jgi:hypothetical protein
MSQEGELSKRNSGAFKRWQKRHIKLSTKRLTWRKDKQETSERQSDFGCIFLRDVTGTSVEQSTSTDFGVICAQRTYYFQAASTSERARWVRLIDDCVDKVQQYQGWEKEFERASKEKAVVLTPPHKRNAGLPNSSSRNGQTLSLDFDAI